MYRGRLPAVGILTASLWLALISTACDPAEGSESESANARSESDPRDGEDEDAPFAPEQPDPKRAQLLDLLGQDPLPNHPISSLEVFVIPAADTMAITGASNGFLAPFPAGIMPMDEPEIADGILIATKLRDLGRNLVGFATEQEVFDSVNASSDTTYTLTIPGRGTIMLKQQEDFSGPFAEVEDMIADQEFIRTFDPPLIFVTTVPWSGSVVGGTGEFEGAQGYMLEIDIVHQINLVDRVLDVTVVLPIGLF